VHPGTSRTERTTVRRHIHADPTSTALLLAAPSAFELWPGVHRVAEVGGRAVVEAALTTRPHAAATVRALPPRRTPSSYVSRFEWAGPGLPATTGELTLSFLPGADGTLETEATLVLESDGTLAELHELATGFLLNLASAAELRSRAA
jgi:hypothetical protein